MPTATFPKFAAEGEIDNWPAATPEPLNEIAVVGFVAFDATAIIPLAVPPAKGVNTTLNV
ncbi:MAG: hypothetical protein NVS1B11_34440 [Terriglobales bacterium]